MKLYFSCNRNKIYPGLVAIENNRNFTGCEISEKYCKMAVKRIEPAASQINFFNEI